MLDNLVAKRNKRICSSCREHLLEVICIVISRSLATIDSPLMWPLSKTSRAALCTLTGAATALTLYCIVARTAVKQSNWHFSVHRNSLDDRPSANVSHQPWTVATGDECTNLSTNSTSVLTLSNVNGADLNVYKAFASKNVFSPKGIELLSPSTRADIAKEVGLDFDVAARLLKLCYSYIKSFNRCHYKLLSDPGPCSADAAATSVIVVHSLPASTQRRMDIRARLLQFRATGYRVVFLLGRSESEQSEADVRKEVAVYGDIIWADFFEDYDNLTIKTLVMLRWMEHNCLSARYLVKADDDVYLKMSPLNAVLTANLNRTRIIMGSIGFGEGAYRSANQKWYMPMYMFSGNTYPPFAHGPSYAISTDLIADLNEAALKINFIHLEDIFVAVCASTLTNVHHVHVPTFITSSCNVHEAIALHGVVCP